MTEEEKAFVQAFDDRCKLYSKLLSENREQEAQEILDNLKEKVWQVNLVNMQKNFETNVRFLSKYPFLLNKNFVAPKDNKYLLFILNADVAFRFDQENKKFETLEINSIRETKYFFKELNKPLLLESEYNQYNLQFFLHEINRQIY